MILYDDIIYDEAVDCNGYAHTHDHVCRAGVFLRIGQLSRPRPLSYLAFPKVGTDSQEYTFVLECSGLGASRCPVPSPLCVFALRRMALCNSRSSSRIGGSDAICSLSKAEFALRWMCGSWSDNRGSTYRLSLYDGVMSVCTTRPSGEVLATIGLIRVQQDDGQDVVVWGKVGGRAQYALEKRSDNSLQWRAKRGHFKPFTWKRIRESFADDTVQSVLPQRRARGITHTNCSHRMGNNADTALARQVRAQNQAQGAYLIEMMRKAPTSHNVCGLNYDCQKPNCTLKHPQGRRVEQNPETSIAVWHGRYCDGTALEDNDERFAHRRPVGSWSPSKRRMSSLMRRPRQRSSDCDVCRVRRHRDDISIRERRARRCVKQVRVGETGSSSFLLTAVLGV